MRLPESPHRRLILEEAQVAQTEPKQPVRRRKNLLRTPNKRRKKQRPLDHPTKKNNPPIRLPVLSLPIYLSTSIYPALLSVSMCLCWLKEKRIPPALPRPLPPVLHFRERRQNADKREAAQEETLHGLSTRRGAMAKAISVLMILRPY